MKPKHFCAFLCGLLIACSHPLSAAADGGLSLHLSPAANTHGILVTNSDGISAAANLYPVPEAYDLRETGCVTSVKDQNPYGTCWIFASMNAIESAAIANNPHVDLSEWYNAHYAFKGPLDDPDIPEDYLMNGGNAEQMAAMLMNWVGPVPESACPYNMDTPDFTKTLAELRREAIYHVTDYHYLPSLYMQGTQDLTGDRDIRRQQIKQAIYEGHALYFDINMALFDYDVFNEENASYYVSDAAQDAIMATFDAEDENTELPQGHAMSIVGWDDNFPATAFTYQPPENGAWLVKNSWGTDWGDDGYFWMSYSQNDMDNFMYYDIEPASQHDTLYAHDDFGCCGAFSISNNYDDKQAYIANCFTAEKDTWITDVMVNCANVDDQCEIIVYSGLTDSSPVSGTASAVTRVSLNHLGYQTVQLSEPVLVNAGERFSVVAKLFGTEGCHIPCELAIANPGQPVGIAQTTVNGNGFIHRDRIERDFHAGESFYSADGSEWLDIYENRITKDSIGDEFCIGNVCIKALGVDLGTVHFSEDHESLPLNTIISLSTPGDTPIYYAIDGGEAVLYDEEEPIRFTGSMVLSAYTDVGDKKVYTRTYTQQKAELSSLLLADGDRKEYVELNDLSGERELAYTTPGMSYLCPIAMGQITINGTEWQSGKKYPLQLDAAAKEIEITVSNPNQLTTTYTLLMKSFAGDPLPNGVWMGYEQFESGLSNMVAYEFQNGKGNSKDLATGITEAFTYHLTKDGFITFQYEDRTAVKKFVSRKYGDELSDEPTYYSTTLIEDGCPTLSLSRESEQTFEQCPIYSYEELTELFAAYYEDAYGKKPKELESDGVWLNVVDEDGTAHSYTLSTYGTAYGDTEEQEELILGTALGDIDKDRNINASDAAQILAEAAILGSGGNGTFVYAQKQAADINGDGAINAGDAADLLTYAAAVGAGNTEIRLADFRMNT